MRCSHEHRVTVFQLWYEKSKETDERHANSTFSQGVHWGQRLLFYQNPMLPSTRNREGTGRVRQKQQAAANP